MHTLADMAETCTKLFSMKRRFDEYIVSLLNITAYCSMELLSFLKMLKIHDHQPCANKCMYLTNTLKYEDNKNIFEFLEL